MRVLKGHGTENDFVVLPDLDAQVELTARLVRALCDRHAGIGADGVLRVVRTALVPEVSALARDAEFFMDYRNADGSLAEMCGNGVRVFHAYLRAAGLVKEDAAVATRGGIKRVRTVDGDNVTVEMGPPLVLADRPVVTAALHPATGRTALPAVFPPATAVGMPNPHVVTWVGSRAELDALDLSVAPRVEPALPHGQNVEFVHRPAPRHLVMRVHERGVGETRSCGTGICAVVVAAASADGVGADGTPWRVDVPGGTCEVVWRADGEVLLTGPAVLVATLDLDDAWLANALEG